jgi:hypothetical protein
MSQELATDVIALFQTRVDAITSESPASGFQVSPYRLTLEKESDGAVDGMYFVRVDAIRPHARSYGNQENIWEADVTIEVGYYRGGGDMAGGDRQSVMRNAADDAMRIADMVETPVNYDGSNTGVREIRFLGAELFQQTAHKEVWAVRFWVQWRSDWVQS